jgi:hypothetical protein
MEEKKDAAFDISQLLNLVPGNKHKFTPKVSKKHWEDAEIVMLGAMVSHLKERGIKNPELKNEINNRLDSFEKNRQTKEFYAEDLAPVSDAEMELEKIKKIKNEIDLSRLSHSKKLSDKTKNLLKSALSKALTEKFKKGDIIIDSQNEKSAPAEISSEEKKKVASMLEIAIKAGIIDKNDLKP